MVLLDEPFAGVNPVMATGVMAAISDLASRGITILLVEHNLGIVERLASVVVVMSEGHEIAKGRMQDLRSHAAVSDAYLGTAR
jgi:ABC-type branched-subunit amino acid transport system ATPase component